MTRRIFATSKPSQGFGPLVPLTRREIWELAELKRRRENNRIDVK